MSLKQLVFALIVVFSTHTLSHAVDTLRYALISLTPAIQAPQLPTLKAPATEKSPYARIPERREPETIKVNDENLVDWTPMSIEALGYDIREVWRENETPFTFWLGVGPR